jgi:hypothetical protein
VTARCEGNGIGAGAPPPSSSTRVIAHSARTSVALLVLCATCLSIFSLAQKPASAQAPTTVFPVTGFGGYSVGESAVSQISASWRVPTVLASSRPGYGSTWIGVQNENTGTPFIQLGTIENKVGPGHISYEAFWSDVTVGFRPQFFAAVSPDELVSVSMVRGSSGWTLTMDVGNNSKPTTKVIAYGVGQTFSQAEWLQEDPAPASVTAVDEPYPQLSPVVFKDLRVNDRVPHLTRSDGATLSAQDGIYLVPSTVRDGSFSLVAPKGAAKTYLVLAARLDHAISVYDVQLSKWNTLSRKARKAAVLNLASAYSENASQFASHSWPRRSQHLIGLLGKQLRRLNADIENWSKAGLSLSGPAYRKLTNDENVTPVANRVRSSLGLPPP